MADMQTITASEVSNIAGKTEWVDGLRIDAERESFFGPGFVGAPGSDSVIIEHKKIEGGKAGIAIDVPLVGNLEGEGVEGETALDGNEEDLSNSHQAVTVALMRHGVASTALARFTSAVDLMGFGRPALGRWAGHKRDEKIFTVIKAVVARLFGGDATARSELGSDDTFGCAELTAIKYALIRKGARPLRVEVDEHGRKIPYYGVVISAVDAANLQTDATWIAAHQAVGELAAKNPIFSGAMGVWNGMIVYVYGELHGSGSALRPETLLSADLAIDAETVTVGGGKTGVDYTKHFPSAGTLLIGSEKITYTGKTAGSFTGCTRGAGGTDAATHSENDLVTANNLTTQVGFGAEAIAKATAGELNYVTETGDYGNKLGLGVQMIEGYAVVVDTNGKPSNLVVMECYGVSPDAA